MYEYFVHGITPEEYLATKDNIFDYCGGIKIKGDWHFVQKYIQLLSVLVLFALHYL